MENKCLNCKELEKLKAENKELLQEQDLMFLLLNITLGAVKKWGVEHGLIDVEKQNSDSIDNQNSSIPTKKDIKDNFLNIFNALGF